MKAASDKGSRQPYEPDGATTRMPCQAWCAATNSGGLSIVTGSRARPTICSGTHT